MTTTSLGTAGTMSSEQAPEPRTTPPEESPGGADAFEHDNGPGGPTGRDLPPEDNPAVDEVLPEEISAPDDKEQGPDEGTSGEGPVPQEPPA